MKNIGNCKVRSNLYTFKAWRRYNDEWLIFDDNHIMKSRNFIDKFKSVTSIIFEITE
jgi:hypothetical protein